MRRTSHVDCWHSRSLGAQHREQVCDQLLPAVRHAVALVFQRLQRVSDDANRPADDCEGVRQPGIG